MSSEEERIAELTRIFDVESPDVRVGIGDDAAVLAPDLVLSVDVCVEGTHFRRSFGALDGLARRAVVGALSDLAAMGAEPRAVLSSLILPPDIDDEALAQLHRGIAAAADEVGVPVIGGNLAAGSELSLTTTVVGRGEAPLLRRGARSGDGIFVTGAPGDAGLGLLALLAARESAFSESWLAPRAHIEEGLALRGIASACVDVSDGLLRDLHHLCEASGVGAEIDAEAVPRGASFDDEARALGHDPDDVLLGSGEAYVLLFTAPGQPPVGVRIGTIGGVGVRVRGRDGVLREQPPRGFDHFG